MMAGLVGDSVLAPTVVAAGAIAALQIADAVLALRDAATVRDTDEPDALTKRRGRELFWVLAVTAVLAVLLAYGVDRAASSVWPASAVVLGLSALAAFGVGCIGVLALLRRERPTYARLRRDLRDRSTFTVDPSELLDFETRLERADRVRLRRPVAAGVLRGIGAVLLVGTSGLAALARPELSAAAVIVVVLGLAGLVVALRASAVRRARVEVVLDAQRAEVVALLERARIPQRRTVPGLRERVTRALAILRERQP